MVWCCGRLKQPLLSCPKALPSWCKCESNTRKQSSITNEIFRRWLLDQLSFSAQRCFKSRMNILPLFMLSKFKLNFLFFFFFSLQAQKEWRSEEECWPRNRRVRSLVTSGLTTFHSCFFFIKNIVPSRHPQSYFFFFSPFLITFIHHTGPAPKDVLSCFSHFLPVVAFDVENISFFTHTRQPEKGHFHFLRVKKFGMALISWFCFSFELSRSYAINVFFDSLFI